MKAITLEQVLRNFDPKRPLSGPDLRFWFVQREGSPRRRLGIALKEQLGPQKALFVGHRGTGKTTELNKLAEELADQFFTIGFDVLGITGRTTPEYEDLMLAMSTQVMRHCVEHHLVNKRISEPVRRGWEDLLNWWRSVTIAQEIRQLADETNVGLQLNTLLGQVELGAKQSSQTREALKFQLNQQMPELIRRLNWVIEQAESSSRQRLLIVVEGLDKIDLESASYIFRDHAPTITAPNATMIFTFPLALRHSHHYNTIRLSFPEVQVLPNIAVRHSDGTSNPYGVETLRGLVLARMEERLIEPEALDLIIHANGGIPVWLVTLMRASALYALERDLRATEITVTDVRNAVKDLWRESVVSLTLRDLKLLRARHRDRRLTNDEDEQRLLYNGSLIEYFNDTQWCDAHPALWSLLEQDDDSLGTDANN